MMKKLKHALWCWFWRHRLENGTVFKVTGWNSALVDEHGYGRHRVWFCLFRGKNPG